MTGFKLQTTGFGSEHSTNCAQSIQHSVSVNRVVIGIQTDIANIEPNYPSGFVFLQLLMKIFIPLSQSDGDPNPRD